MQTQTQSQTQQNWSISDDFNSKLTKCLRPGRDHSWILQSINDNLTLKEICEDYININGVDIYTDAVSGLFESYLMYKSNKSIKEKHDKTSA